MTVQIDSDDLSDIEFKVKGKIKLVLTRRGLIYRNKLVEDGGKVLELMTKFLGLAENDIQNQAHEAVTSKTVSQQARLTDLQSQSQTMAIIQVSETGEDDGYWVSRFEPDVPEWVKEPEEMTDMIRNGAKLKADGGGLWYRAVLMVPKGAIVN
jgi:hypothetical protein